MHDRKGIDIASALLPILKKVVADINKFILRSDSCVPQNRNSIISFALEKFMKEFSYVTEITQKFPEPGHGQVVDLGMLGKDTSQCEPKKTIHSFHMQQHSFKDYEIGSCRRNRSQSGSVCLCEGT
ncbi:hypothetical protein JTB14_036290 [Gonioctena quinquepunctata]|nr:hypothetical protein JTB14_036290 [Gonioctena quinquepunctata]